MKKILGAVLMFFGVLFALSSLLNFSSNVPAAIFGLVLGCAIIYGGLKLMRNTKTTVQRLDEKQTATSSKAVTVPPVEPVIPTAPVVPPVGDSVKCEHHKVTGVAHYFDNIMNLPLENPSYGCSKSELIDDNLIDERIYKYWYYNKHIELVEEPTNVYDPNAVKVVVEGQHVGYIKKGSCLHIKKLLASCSIKNVCCTIEGGDYKYLSESEDEDGNDVYNLEKNKNDAIYIDLDVFIKE